MNKNYFHKSVFIVFFALFTSLSFAQVSSNPLAQNKTSVVKTIESLSIYPNPVMANGKIAIETT